MRGMPSTSTGEAATTLSPSITGIDRKATVWRSLEPTNLSLELHRARQPLRWPMVAEFGQPGNFHPTLQISLSPHGTGRRSKTSLSTTIYRADVGQPKAALYAPGRGILACASMTVIGSFTFRQITTLISTKVPECDVPTFHGESHRGFAEYQVGSGGRRTELQA